MAKKATSKTAGKAKASKSKAVAVRTRSTGGSKRSSESYGDALVKLLQSPLVAELVAVAATAALGALAQEGVSGKGSGGKRAGNAVKKAGKAAAKAIGDRLTTEVDEIKKAATAKRSAKG